MLGQTHIGDCRQTMRSMHAAGVVAQCVVTSPPYFGLRDYQTEGQIGLERSLGEYVEAMVDVFRSVRDVLADDGVLWLNLGDSYVSKGGCVTPQAGHQFSTRTRGREVVCRSNRDVETGLKPKDRMMVPARVAMALQADGWWLRDEIVWHKPNPMPSSVRDRTTSAHEMVYLLSKSRRYYFDQEAIAEPASYGEPNAPDKIKSPMGQGYTRRAGRWPSGWARGDEPRDVVAFSREVGRSGNKARKPGSARGCPENTDSNLCGSVPWEGTTRNKRSVWTVSTQPCPDAHFATFPQKLIEPCILAGSRPGDVVFDPFMGAGTTAIVAERLARRWIGCELNPEYVAIQHRRMQGLTPGLPLAAAGE